MGLEWRHVWLVSVIVVASIGVAPRGLANWTAGTPAGVQQPSGRNGAVRGRVDIGQLARVVERRPGVSDLGAQRARDEPDRARSVVYLESAPRAAFDLVEPGRASMDQRNETFVPHVLAVTAGTIVDFPNSDRFYHNVFSLSKAARFDLGRYATGKSKSVRFDQPGIVRVFCEIHSHMNAFVLVFAHPFFAMTDGEGRYRINNVPAGTYNVIAWNEGIASEPKPVTIVAGGLAELDVAVR
jgi:plastocyanin